MTVGRCILLLSTVSCVVQCVKVLPIDGTAITLDRGFNVKPSPVALPVFTTAAVPADDTAIKQTILPLQIPSTFELNTVIPSAAKVQFETTGPAIEPTPKLPAIQDEPESVTREDFNAIIPTSVVAKPSSLKTYDVPENNLLPPKL